MSRGKRSSVNTNAGSVDLIRRLDELATAAAGRTLPDPEEAAWAIALPIYEDWRRKKRHGYERYKKISRRIVREHVEVIFDLQLSPGDVFATEVRMAPTRLPRHLWTSEAFKWWLRANDNCEQRKDQAIAWFLYIRDGHRRPDAPWLAPGTVALHVAVDENPRPESTRLQLPSRWFEDRYSTGYGKIVHLIRQLYNANKDSLGDAARQYKRKIDSALLRRRIRASVNARLIELDSYRLLFKAAYDDRYDRGKDLANHASIRERGLRALLQSPFDAACDLITVEISTRGRTSLDEIREAVALATSSTRDPHNLSRFAIATPHQLTFDGGQPMFGLQHFRCRINDAAGVPKSRGFELAVADAMEYVSRYTTDHSYRGRASPETGRRRKPSRVRPLCVRRVLRRQDARPLYPRRARFDRHLQHVRNQSLA